MNGATLSSKSRLMVDEFDISGFLRKGTPQRARDMVECSDLTSTSHEYTPALRGGQFVLDGMYRSNSVAGTALHGIFSSLPSTQLILTGYPETRAIGKAALLQ